ncbi:hypothetical protein M0R45_015779 [Rubus argutus]|uniref:Xrn1 helical domain-containing protein n=1 Tax=Rubus argutus TaxID=59490 RepID=A0AAW1XSL2_RUBAR
MDTLMAVLPPRSAHALPSEYRKLMVEESSSIIDFYPTDFQIDMDGKRFTWQGICKLPFIEEERLLNETRKLEKDLVGEESDRNAKKLDQLFMRSTHDMASQIVSLSSGENQLVKIDTSLSFGIGGFIRCLDENTEHSSKEHTVLCVLYELPNTVPHIPRLLNGVELPNKTITEHELMESVLWHEFQGNAPTRSIQLVQSRLTNSNNMGNACIKNNARFTSSSPSDPIHKFAGSGWGCGRGRANGSSASGEQIYSPKSIPGDQTVLSSTSSYSTKGTSDYRRGPLHHHAIKELKITESGQCWRPYGRGVQSLNNGFWPSRNGASQGRNYAGQGSQCYHNQGRGRGQHDPWQHTYPFVGTGRGQQDSWTHTRPPVASTGRCQQDSWTHTRPPFAANSSSPQAGTKGSWVQRSHVSESHNGQ